VLKTDLFEEAFGPDALVPELAAAAERVYAFDISPGAARAGSSRCQALAVASDVRRLPFAGGSFDLILSPSTLDHFPDPADLGVSLRELGRVLRPSGRLIVTLDNRHNITAPLLRLAGWLGLVPFYLGRFYSIGELRRELDAAGFDVLDTTTIVQSPRMMAVLPVMLSKKLRWAFLERQVRRVLTWMQKFEGTRIGYFTGSFAAAVAVKRGR